VNLALGLHVNHFGRAPRRRHRMVAGSPTLGARVVSGTIPKRTVGAVDGVAACAPGWLRSAGNVAVPRRIARGWSGWAYLLRPAVAQDRLRLLADGRVVLTLKSAWTEEARASCLRSVVQQRPRRLR
jgi:hypothetical protein